ncbi:MAG TPA: hypothetical protein VF482_01275, partial [Trebonia sp.]
LVCGAYTFDGGLCSSVLAAPGAAPPRWFSALGDPIAGPALREVGIPPGQYRGLIAPATQQPAKRAS